VEINRFSDAILDEKDILFGLYSGKLTSVLHLNVVDQELINRFNSNIELNADPIDRLSLYIDPDCTIEEYDKRNQAQWHIPSSYKTFDIANWLLEQCQTEIAYNRVIEEIELYIQYDMVDVLVYLKYLVDYMRENNIVWGLGRGSSVASYCLYLIGIHKVDSIKYQLDIKEFLKGNRE